MNLPTYDIIPVYQFVNNNVELITMPYRLVTVHEKDLWNRYVHACKMYDFYHTWYYHSLEKSGEPVLFV